MEQNFDLQSVFNPTGDQPKAIENLSKGLSDGYKKQTLLGVTGSGKTYTMANVIQEIQKPTLVISHNKTLAKQLYNEFQTFFPNNSVHYFVSTYSYYQPEAYIPALDQYIEKKARINEEILWMRYFATSSLLTRKDTLIVASTSCLFGVGSPVEFRKNKLSLSIGQTLSREKLLKDLVEMQYERQHNFHEQHNSRGTFQVRGDIIIVHPMDSKNPYRIELFGNEIDLITEVEKDDFSTIKQLDSLNIFPAQHFMLKKDTFKESLVSIEEELNERVYWFKKQSKMIEAERLQERVSYDLELLRTTGYCPGVEVYASHFFNLKEDEPTACLLHYFPEDYLLFIDESHVTIPQLQAMAPGSNSRLKQLIDHGFRLPSAMSNRPLRFNELEDRINQAIFVSATPSQYEIDGSESVIEQIIRPTGLIDPKMQVYLSKGKLKHLKAKIEEHINKGNQVLITTLTKNTTEQLTEKLQELGFKAEYLHGEVELMKRESILQQFKSKKFDILVGINLLREGLDLPQVSLVAVLNADKKGFLRSTTALIQVCGRAARNIDGEVILYANEITDSMEQAIEETERRRQLQIEYNTKNNIVPRSIEKNLLFN